MADKPAAPSVSSPRQGPVKDSSESANAVGSSPKEEMQLDNALAADLQTMHAELPAQEAIKPADTAEHMQN